MTKTKSLEKQIYREIWKAIKKHSDLWTSYYFNNFKGHLPKGYYREHFPKSFNDWDEKHSKLLKKQTMGEFHETIDNVISQLGFSKEEFIAFQSQLSQVPETGDFYIEKCTPLYIKLREMGYNHYPDLTR